MFTKPLRLPNDQVLTNRIAKAAMEEDLAHFGVPGHQHENLYRRWAQGGVGLLITGNVMIDKTAPTGAGVVVLEDERHLDNFRRWALAGKSHGATIIMQLSHPGRQIPKPLGVKPVAPSPIGVEVPGGRGMFNPPRALSHQEIEAIIERFVTSAKLAIKAGFDGVQLHGAHGYLINQFLSPLTNKRQDQWGGALENRVRFLLEIVRKVRNAIGPEAILSVKLNSADFQRGGFSEQECSEVIKILNQYGIDLLEISGGNYESPVMFGERCATREAFFLEFATKAKQMAAMPIMVTGGFRSVQGINQALQDEAVDVVGLAKPFCVEPDLVTKLQKGIIEHVDWPVKWLNNPALNSLSQLSYAQTQMKRMANGRDVTNKLGTIRNLIVSIIEMQYKSMRYRHWLARAK